MHEQRGKNLLPLLLLPGGDDDDIDDDDGDDSGAICSVNKTNMDLGATVVILSKDATIAPQLCLFSPQIYHFFYQHLCAFLC